MGGITVPFLHLVRMETPLHRLEEMVALHQLGLLETLEEVVAFHQLGLLETLEEVVAFLQLGLKEQLKKGNGGGELLLVKEFLILL